MPVAGEAARVVPSRSAARGSGAVIEPGHDAEVIGEERFVAYEFESSSAEKYARE